MDFTQEVVWERIYLKVKYSHAAPIVRIYSYTVLRIQILEKMQGGWCGERVYFVRKASSLQLNRSVYIFTLGCDPNSLFSVDNDMSGLITFSYL